MEAYKLVQKPCISLDCGFLIDELNGFPRAFVNFALDTIGIEGILKLMEGKENRSCRFTECLSYYDGKELHQFMGKHEGTLTTEIVGTDSNEKWSNLWYIYKPAGYDIIFTSAKAGIHLEELRALLKGKTTTVAGPSGVGKSSLINQLQDSIYMETGSISEKIERGKHTTRHSEIIPLGEDAYIMDTPGFSSMDMPGFEKEDLWTCYPEFLPHEPYCKFQGCSHISEPNCGVKDALAEGQINQVRYDNYVLLYNEMKQIRKY